ncbi:hypothetical protein EDB86DRAFT_2833382 [Lactarius hatsudake]|nr:hypothetical protein EDB86DRAFT_2833382 [Lactarius hatsudake]
MINTGPSWLAGGEHGDVRATIDEDKLNAYLAKNVPAMAVPVTVKQFKSNPTKDARGLRFVLGKKPAGQLVSRTAHQVEREYTHYARRHSQTQLAPDDSPRIARPRLEDSEVIGTPFYVMGLLEPEGRSSRTCRCPACPQKFGASGALPSLDPRQVRRSSAHTSRTSRPSFLFLKIRGGAPRQT